MDRAADPHTASSSRTAFVARGALVGGALAVGGGLGLLGRASPAEAAAPSPEQDRKIFNFALLLEYLQAAFYTQAVAHGRLTGEVRSFAEVVAGHERAHVGYLRKALGPHARPRPAFDFGRSEERRVG